MPQQKFEREIEKIVSKADLGPKVPLREKVAKSLTPIANAAKPTFLGGAGALILVAGLFIRSAWPIFIGIGLMLLAYLVYLIRDKPTFKGTTGFEKSWRGRKLDDK